jgi:hypothetical protein
MGLDPALEKPGRDRELDRLDLDGIELHAGEPTEIDVLADFDAEAVLHAQPSLLINAVHFHPIMVEKALNRTRLKLGHGRTHQIDGEWKNADREQMARRAEASRAVPATAGRRRQGGAGRPGTMRGPAE